MRGQGATVQADGHALPEGGKDLRGQDKSLLVGINSVVSTMQFYILKGLFQWFC